MSIPFFFHLFPFLLSLFAPPLLHSLIYLSFCIHSVPVNREASPVACRFLKRLSSYEVSVESSDKITVTWVGWDQIRLVVKFYKIGVDASCGPHWVLVDSLRFSCWIANCVLGSGVWNGYGPFYCQLLASKIWEWNSEKQSKKVKLLSNLHHYDGHLLNGLVSKQPL